MMGNLIRKELLDNLLSFRFVVSSVIVIFIMVLSTGILMQDYANQRDSYNQNQSAHYKHAESFDNYIEFMFSGIGAERPPSELQFFYTGVEKNPNRSTTIFPFFKPSFRGELNLNPIFPLFPAVDLMFVVSIVMSLLAFVFSYDAVCGERQSGTLKLLMSYSISRDKIILSKWIGGYVTLIIPYLIGIVLCILMIIINPRVTVSGDNWAAFMMTVLVSLLFIGVMYSIGLLVSVTSRIPAASISILLFIWVIIVLVIPNSVPFVVDQIKPIDSPSLVQSRIKFKTGQSVNKLIDETISTFEEATGVNINDIDFSGMRPEEEEDKSDSKKKESSASTTTSTTKSSGGGGGSNATADIASKVDMGQLEKVIGGITDNDLRELRLKGCKYWVDKQLKAQVGITLEQAETLAKDMGYDIDTKALLRECEARKKELIDMKRSGQSAEEIASSEMAKQGGTTSAVKSTASSQPAQTSTAKVKPQEVVGKYMALSEEEKGRAIDKMYASFVNAFKANSEVSKEEEERYQRSVDGQIALTKNLSRISPVSSYIYAVTDLANTGIEREKHMKKYLWDYQAQFLDFLTRKFNVPDKERVHKIFGGFFREAEFNLDDLPRFKYREMSFAGRMKLVMVDIVVLFSFMVILFLAAFMSFLRAEIID
ncbi:MAG TPA: ABC transporter permease subunit [bacterium]|nr:ABC transporter permease subunit [bacterium]